MEYNQTLDSGLYKELELETAARDYLLEAAKWGKFLSIVGFIFTGLMVVASFFVGTIFSSMNDLQGIEGGEDLGGLAMLGGGVITFFYLLVALLYFVPTFYFYRFSTNTKAAIENGSSTDLTAGLGNLKSCFKFWGIFTIVILGFYALMFLFGLLGLAFAG